VSKKSTESEPKNTCHSLHFGIKNFPNFRPKKIRKIKKITVFKYRFVIFQRENSVSIEIDNEKMIYFKLVSFIIVF